MKTIIRIVLSLIVVSLWSSNSYADSYLHSMPGASHSIYLDVDGEPASPWFVYDVPETPRYTGNVPMLWASAERAFSDPHVIDLLTGVVRVAAPLDVDVTTSPAPEKLVTGRDLKVIIGGYDSWYSGGGSSGVAWVGSFDFDFLPRTVYVFSAVFNDDPLYSGEIVAHEAGHAFGLDHPNGGYVPGRWMGSPFGAAPPVWSIDEYDHLYELLGSAASVPEPSDARVLIGFACIACVLWPRCSGRRSSK